MVVELYGCPISQKFLQLLPLPDGEVQVPLQGLRSVLHRSSLCCIVFPIQTLFISFVCLIQLFINNFLNFSFVSEYMNLFIHPHMHPCVRISVRQSMHLYVYLCMHASTETSDRADPHNEHRHKVQLQGGR